MTQQQLQNCIDWNIKLRDGARSAALRLSVTMPLSAAEYTRNARRYQQNIDTLNKQLGGSK